MADHGQLINSRTYWTWTGPDGKPTSGDQPPAGSGGIAGTGIGGSAAPKATQYQEQTYEDGTKVLSRWDADKTQWEQESVTVDPGLRGQNKDTQAAAKAGQETPAQAETRRHNEATETAAATTATRTANTAAAQAARADRTENRQITAAEATAKATALRDERANAIASRRMSVEEANAKYDRDYKEQVEIPLKRSAEQRAIEAAKRAEDQAKFEREKYANEQVSAREKETTRQREAGIKFSYDAGQDAVKQAMDLLPYSVGPTFGAEFAAGLNTLSSGGGPVNFTPGAITFDAPDYNAIAEQAAQRAHAMYSLPAPAAPAAPAAPVAAAAVPGAVPGAVPPVTPANRDVWMR